ncbi:MAG: N-acetylglucosamine-6-phosphate deacetylase [Armatimonadota bacterium]|nr:N-acetylglucosamine-6-phosphate deacetylase [Armatimonadota bacterium]
MHTITGNIITLDEILTNGALVIDDDGRIAEVSHQRTSPPRSGDIDARGHWVVPGFLDMHVHGGGGTDFMRGIPTDVRQVVRTHARFGTTGLLATTWTASHEDTDAAVQAIRTVMEEGREADEARILGIHLEGPFICREKRGAQPEAFVRPPDLEEFAHWVALSGNTVRQITLAPEVDGAEALIKAARAQNVIVSIGHTDAKAAEVLEAIDWGATQATHTFNAMRGLHQREPGTVGAVLARPEIMAEIIADGVHLHPLVVRLIVAAKGILGAVLITDAIQGAAMPDGEYTLGEETTFMRNGTAAFADGTLAGSVLTMNRAFANVQKFAGVGPSQASLLASRNAARQLKLADRFGSLAPGKDADIAIVHPETGDIAWTLIGGQVAHKA